MFCRFLSLVLRNELDRCLDKAGHNFEWADIKQDLKALQKMEVEENGKSPAFRTECIGSCGKASRAVGVAIPPTIREKLICQREQSVVPKTFSLYLCD